ncbi:MAG TPA: phage holin family protein [Egibacteraceae bacterium]
MTAPSSNGRRSGFEERATRVRDVFRRRPTTGVGPAAQAVLDDAKALVQAEIALGKAELQQKAKEKGTGAGLMAAAAVLGWLGLQGLLITIGFVLALWLPGWAAALIVTAVLLLAAGIAALLGRKQLAKPVGVDTTKQNVEEDLAWIKAHLPDLERLKNADPPRS